MKTSSSIPCFPPAVLLAVFLLLLSGCANLDRRASSGGPMVVVESENVYVTGSHIPVRVPKSASVRTLPTISPLTVLTADDMRRAMGPAPAPMH
jgi:hypothetical protein